MLLYLIVMVPFLLLGWWSQHYVSSSFRSWSNRPANHGKSGAEVAREILDRNGLTNVTVHHTPGELSDHYDPRKRSVHLSDSVYGSRSIAASAVAAHEVGHAIQHAKSYAPLAIRSALFPVASFGSAAFMPLFIIGMLMFAAGNALGETAILIAIALFAAGVFFQLVTLPVEFDASKRAREQLSVMALAPTAGEDAVGTAKVLNAAALTYVAAALAALAQLAYYIMMFVVRRD